MAPGRIIAYNAAVEDPFPGDAIVARIISLIVLVVILVIIGALFFEVMAGFLLPVFLAVLLTVMFGPLHRWFVARCQGRVRVAAALTTSAILLIVLLPLLLVTFQAVRESISVYRRLNPSKVEVSEKKRSAKTEPAESSTGEQPADDSHKEGADKTSEAKALLTFINETSQEIADLGHRVGLSLSAEDVQKTVMERLQEWLAPAALHTSQYVGSFLIGLLVMVISLYYFLADGPAMIGALARLLPLEPSHTQRLIAQFVTVSRAVVVATLLSAVIQGLLTGLGFYVAGFHSIFLFTVLAMLMAMVPFIGPPAVWAPACLWLFFYEHHFWAGVAMTVYALIIISTVDNIVKPLVLHGQSNLHPLLALLSVLGGMQALGPIGIFVGPMVVAFLQTLLNILHDELESMRAQQPSG